MSAREREPDRQSEPPFLAEWATREAFQLPLGRGLNLQRVGLRSWNLRQPRYGRAARKLAGTCLLAAHTRCTGQWVAVLSQAAANQMEILTAVGRFGVVGKAGQARERVEPNES